MIGQGAGRVSTERARVSTELEYGSSDKVVGDRARGYAAARSEACPHSCIPWGSVIGVIPIWMLGHFGWAVGSVPDLLPRIVPRARELAGVDVMTQLLLASFVLDGFFPLPSAFLPGIHS